MLGTGGTLTTGTGGARVTNDKRGSYTARFHEREGWEQRITKWHYVDSEVGDAVLTYCGRKLALNLKPEPLHSSTGDRLRFFGEMAASGEDMCQVCANADTPPTA